MSLTCHFLEITVSIKGNGILVCLSPLFPTKAFQEYIHIGARKAMLTVFFQLYVSSVVNSSQASACTVLSFSQDFSHTVPSALSVFHHHLTQLISAYHSKCNFGSISFGQPPLNFQAQQTIAYQMSLLCASLKPRNFPYQITLPYNCLFSSLYLPRDCKFLQSKDCLPPLL